MSRDHFLFLLIGLLAGFLAGYLLHETMAGVQPARVAAGAAGVSAAPPMGGGSAPAPAAAGGAPMAEINRLRQILEKNPDDLQALIELANLNFDIQNWSRAQALYEHFLELRPDDPDVLTDLGITLRAQGSFDRALELFRKASSLQPNHWQSRFNEVVVLAFDKKDFAAARAILAELEKIAPGNPDIARLSAEVQRLQTSS